MTNKYLGTVDFPLGEQTFKLVFDWGAIAEVMSKFGKDVFVDLFRASPDEIAEMLAIGLRASGITKAEILKLSPPIVPTAQLIDHAITYAYFGPDGRPGASSDGKKKSE